MQIVCFRPAISGHSSRGAAPAGNMVAVGAFGRPTGGAFNVRSIAFERPYMDAPSRRLAP
jgi:hypothetical protein